MPKNRVRFVVEIDSRLLPPFNEGEGLCEIASSMGFSKTLAVPSRMLQMICDPSFGLGLYTKDEIEAERKEWGPHLVRCTAENNNLLQMFKRATIISFKACVRFEDSVSIRIGFRRNREELGYLEMTFNRDGVHAGTTGNF